MSQKITFYKDLHIDTAYATIQIVPRGTSTDKESKMKVELTMEQADLLLLELSALIQDFSHPKETIQQVMDIRQQIAQAIVLEKEGQSA